MTGQDGARKLGELAEIHLPSDCADPTHAWNAPAIWAENGETETEGWFCLDGSGLWWFDPAAAVRPLRLVPQDEPMPIATQWGLRSVSGHIVAPFADQAQAAGATFTGDQVVWRRVSDWQDVSDGQQQIVGQPIEDPGTLSDPEVSEGERAAFLGSRLPRDGSAVTVDDVRRAVGRLQAWLDDETASPTILGSILVPLLPVHAGLAGSDEAVALMRGRLRARAASSGILGEGAEMVDAFEAAVRAEAVAEHRADLQHRIEVSTEYENDRRVALAERDEYHRNWQEAEKRTGEAVAEAVAREQQRIITELQSLIAKPLEWERDIYVRDGYRHVLEIVAAGSVPVATPATCEHGSTESHNVTRGVSGMGLVKYESTCPGPVTTPAEPAEQQPVAHIMHRSDESRTLCGEARDGIVVSDAPVVCRACSDEVLNLLCISDSAAEPSVGTGTPAEEILGGSGHAKRQEPTSWQLDTTSLDADVRTERDEWRELAERACAENERLTAEVARLEDDRDNACAWLQHAEEQLALTKRDAKQARVDAGLNAAQRDVALAEVARYRAAIEPSVFSEISAMISGSYPPDLDPEAHMWRRHQKVANEAGEVMDAIEGAIGENPRKGVIGTWADVDKELLDTAAAALGAYEHNHGNDGSALAALLTHAESVHTRLAAALGDGE